MRCQVQKIELCPNVICLQSDLRIFSLQVHKLATGLQCVLGKIYDEIERVFQSKSYWCSY